MRLVIGSDHAGYNLKEELKQFLSSKNYNVLDVGTNSTHSVDYPDYAEALSKVIISKEADRGILICGSGVGACIAANKLPGIRACLCHDTYSAHQGVEHDDMNVIVLGGKIIGPELAKDLVISFLSASFINEERYIRRLNKVKALEEYYNQVID